MKSWMIAFAALALSASSVGVSQAQVAGGAPPPGAAGVRKACAADFARLCPGVDHAGMRQCIAGKLNQLSGGCKSAIAAMRAARRSEGGGPQ